MKINNALIDRLAGRIMDRLAVPHIPLEASGRHVHLSANAVAVLFGPGYQLKEKRPLSQPGQFVCEERVQVTGPKGSISGIVVLGPERKESQLEISLTDARQLGVPAPVRISGNIADTPGITIIGPRGELQISRGVIIAKRHIHMTPGYARLYGFTDQQVVSVRVAGERSLIFDEVPVRVSNAFDNYMHIDYDEANACGFSPGMIGEILITEPVTAGCFRDMPGDIPEPPVLMAVPEVAEANSRKIDLSGKRLVHERDLKEQKPVKGDFIVIDHHAIITALAVDYMKSVGAKMIKKEGGPDDGTAATDI